MTFKRFVRLESWAHIMTKGGGTGVIRRIYKRPYVCKQLVADTWGCVVPCFSRCKQPGLQKGGEGGGGYVMISSLNVSQVLTFSPLPIGHSHEECRCTSL